MTHLDRRKGIPHCGAQRPLGQWGMSKDRAGGGCESPPGMGAFCSAVAFQAPLFAHERLISAGESARHGICQGNELGK